MDLYHKMKALNTKIKKIRERKNFYKFKFFLMHVPMRIEKNKKSMLRAIFYNFYIIHKSFNLSNFAIHFCRALVCF